MADPDIAVAAPLEQTHRRRQTDEEKQPQRQPRYHVVLWNDNDHSYAYVITMLAEVFGHPPERGFQMAKEVDTQGRVIVLTTTREHAELKRDQIHAYGKDVSVDDCKGSMSATIEPAPGEG
jgi:ATP-dependent Clp protease adaptor protein ClpS